MEPALSSKVTLDFCAEELEAKGGREPGRKDDLSVLEAQDCQNILQVNTTKVHICFQVLPYMSLFPVSGSHWKEIFISGTEDAKRVANLGDTAKGLHLWYERSKVVLVENLTKKSGFVQLSEQNCPMIYYREIHDKIPKQKKGLKPNEMKLILNWKLAGEAQGVFDEVKEKGKNDRLLNKGGKMKKQKPVAERKPPKEDYFAY